MYGGKVLIKIFLGIFLYCLSNNIVLATEEIPIYEIQEDGTVYKKREAMQAARLHLKDKDLNKRIAGAKVIYEIAHYEPDSGYDIRTGYSLLINTSDQIIYQIGVEAIKKFMSNEPHFSSNHLDMCFDNLFQIPHLGRGLEKWLQLCKDVGDDKNLRLDLREILAERLRFLQFLRESGLKNKGWYDYLNMPLWKIKELIAQEIEQSNVLADKIIDNPS